MIVPYPFQNDAVDRVSAAFAQGARVVVLQSPTGSGKTTMGCEMIRRAIAKDKRVLEIVHRRRLVDQFSDRLIQFGIDHGICMRGHRLERACRVQVASRDTLLTEGYELPPADLVIIDEGRHACSPEFRKLLRPYDGARIVLLDATPVTPEGNGLGPWAQAMVVAAQISELVRGDVLCPVKCYAPDRKRTRGGKVKRGIAGDLVESWRQYAEDQPTVLFCSRVQYSQEAVEAYNAAGIPAAHVDAATPDDVRDAVFDGLQSGKYKVVSNVGIIKEGVDVPCLGCCQFYMTVNGRVAWIQGAGRIMRPYPGKKHGIVIDHGGAVFKHGFPDEDMDWPLNGNIDAAFEQKHQDGQTETALYCKHCERVYHGQAQCPQCGRAPVRPPKSVFAPPDLDVNSELLTEAERRLKLESSREEKVQHWFRCLMVARTRNGNFKMASAIFRQKYKEWPGDDFPMMPSWGQRDYKVADVYPNFGKRKA